MRKNSSISGSTLLGTPADVYLTGTMFFWMTISMFLCTPATSYLYLPIFHRLQVISANEVSEFYIIADSQYKKP